MDLLGLCIIQMYIIFSAILPTTYVCMDALSTEISDNKIFFYKPNIHHQNICRQYSNLFCGFKRYRHIAENINPSRHSTC